MNTQRQSFFTSLIAAMLLLIAFTLSACGGSDTNSESASNQQASTQPAAKSSGGSITDKQFSYGVSSLVGATPEQVGRFAVEYAQHNATVSGGIPQVLLSRPVTLEDLPNLGLDCVGTPGEYNGRPLVLVVLKGGFQLNQLSLTTTKDSNIYHYLAYVFDLKSAKPTYTKASGNGGAFRLVLNDPTLPVDPNQGSAPTTCRENTVHNALSPDSTATPIPSTP